MSKILQWKLKFKMKTSAESAARTYIHGPGRNCSRRVGLLKTARQTVRERLPSSWNVADVTPSAVLLCRVESRGLRCARRNADFLYASRSESTHYTWSAAHARILQPSSPASRVAQPVRRVFHDEKKIKISKRNAHSQVQRVTAKCKLQLLYSWSFAMVYIYPFEWRSVL